MRRHRSHRRAATLLLLLLLLLLRWVCGKIVPVDTCAAGVETAGKLEIGGVMGWVRAGGGGGGDGRLSSSYLVRDCLVCPPDFSVGFSLRDLSALIGSNQQSNWQLNEFASCIPGR